MIINPYRDRIELVPGTRMLQRQFNFVGQLVADPLEPGRHWVLENAYFTRGTGKALGGLRVKARDQKNFITFINQRDLEYLLGYARTNAICPWLGRPYVTPSGTDWVGFSADDDDLLDDLYEQEIEIRLTYPIIPAGLSLDRRVHYAKGLDRLEHWVFIEDVDPITRTSPDPQLKNIHRRWSLSEKETLHWERAA